MNEFRTECLVLIDTFAARLFDEIVAEGVFNATDHPVTVEAGKRYARIVRNGSVWGFVEIASGDIYKAAGWKAPAKHVRGNIATSSMGNGYAWTGPDYL